LRGMSSMKGTIAELRTIRPRPSASPSRLVTKKKITTVETRICDKRSGADIFVVPLAAYLTPAAELVDFHPGVLDELAPLCDVLAQEAVELGDRHAHRHRALLAPVFLHLRRVQHLDHLGVELLEHRPRRAGGRLDAEPDDRVVAGDSGSGNRWHHWGVIM